MASRLTPQDWDKAATDLVIELVAREHAIVRPEAEAKLSDPRAGHADAIVRVDPHHLTNAFRALLNDGHLVEEVAPTRGGRHIAVLMAASRRGSTSAAARAASRKRLLHARYLSWATGGAEYPHGLIGPGTERVVRHSITAANSLRVIATGAGEVSQLLGVPVHGPLDSGGILSTGRLDAPGPPIAIAVEVKSLRQWIYPQTQELYQLLDKAAIIQALTTSDLPVLPVLVCRRAHYTAFRMAQQLGFYIIALERQYLTSSSVDPSHLAEVRSELGFVDISDSSDSDSRVTRAFREVIPEQTGLRSASIWREVSRNTPLPGHFRTLRQESLRPFQRAIAMDELRHDAHTLGLHDNW